MDVVKGAAEGAAEGAGEEEGYGGASDVKIRGTSWQTAL